MGASWVLPSVTLSTERSMYTYYVPRYNLVVRINFEYYAGNYLYKKRILDLITLFAQSTQISQLFGIFSKKNPHHMSIVHPLF